MSLIQEIKTFNEHMDIQRRIKKHSTLYESYDNFKYWLSLLNIEYCHEHFFFSEILINIRIQIEKCELFINFMIDKNIKINYYDYLIDYFKCVHMCGLTTYLQFELLLKKKIVEPENIDWFNTKKGIIMILMSLKYGNFFLEYLISKNINTYNFTLLISEITNMFINYRNNISQRMHWEQILKYIMKNYEYIIDYNLINEISKYKSYNIYNIIMYAPIKYIAKSAIKSNSNNINKLIEN